MRPILASILLLIPFLLRAQYYNEVSNAIGINHAYQDRMPMGGGCAFLIMTTMETMTFICRAAKIVIIFIEIMAMALLQRLE